MRQAIWSLRRLFALREAIEALDLSAPPMASVVYPETLPLVRRLGVLCGSFNPLTLAHTELAERTQDAFGLDVVLFTLAKVTVDKEQVTGLSLEDRLLLLSLYAQRRGRTGVALVNRGLYFEQAQAFRSLCGAQAELFFIVGMDKLVQILDPQYYQDRAAALRQLFSLASLIVANRGAMAHEAFARLLAQPENRAYRRHIQFCSLPDTVTDVSATAVREGLAAERSVADLTPEETAVFLAETRAFYPPLHRDGVAIDAYAERQRLLAALYANREQDRQEVDFRALTQARTTLGEKPS
jgi:nicotinic acid mononucleotide adenylyltransferase